MNHTIRQLIISTRVWLGLLFAHLILVLLCYWYFCTIYFQFRWKQVAYIPWDHITFHSFFLHPCTYHTWESVPIGKYGEIKILIAVSIDGWSAITVIAGRKHFFSRKNERWDYSVGCRCKISMLLQTNTKKVEYTRHYQVTANKVIKLN